MFRFILFLSSLIILMLYYSAYIDNFANLVKKNGVLISVLVFIGTIIYSWIKKKPKYNHDILKMLEQNPIVSPPKIKNTRSVSAIVKKIVASNQQWKCGECGVVLDYTYEVDHIVPLFKGGTNKQDNLVALCRNCHGRKTILEKID